METQISTNQKNLLTNYLENRITVQEYFQVVEQITAMLVNTQGKGFTFPLNLKEMQIQNGNIQFQITAEDSVYEIAYIKKFLKDITFAAVFAPAENCERVTEFMKFLDNEAQSGNLEAIAEFIKTPQPYVSPEDGETGVLGEGFWENLEGKYQNNTPSSASNYYASDETGVLDPSFWENALKNTPSTRLDNGRVGNEVYGKLIHVKTGKQTLITRDNFWIGKEGVDLQINKEVISRRHAVIISKANHYFISDNDSTNKTYVNNKEIPAKASVEIFAGTRIKFANEEYEFQL